jgi:hypothetical protein
MMELPYGGLHSVEDPAYVGARNGEVQPVEARRNRVPNGARTMDPRVTRRGSRDLGHNPTGTASGVQPWESQGT